jgi:hypothetical protein
MTRQTSIEVYREIKENGLLSKRRQEVFEVLFKHGPMTSGEAFYIMNVYKPDGALTQSRARFTELRNLGVIKENGTKKCNVTGKCAIVWEVTNNVPKNVPKNKTIDLKYKLNAIDFKINELFEKRKSIINKINSRNEKKQQYFMF